METVWIARLPCGCVIDMAEDEEGGVSLLWVIEVTFNGWAVERIDLKDLNDTDCPACQTQKPLKTKLMF